MKVYIREWRVHLDKTQVDLARALGVTKGAISRLENGYRRMTAQWLDQLAKALGITPEMLFSPPSSTEGRTFDTKAKPKATRGGFPLISTDPEVGLEAVTGDEMAPTIDPGDYVVIDKSQTSPSPPGIFAIKEGDTVAIRRLQAMGSSLRVSYDNKMYEAYEAKAEKVSIIGRVTMRMYRI